MAKEDVIEVLGVVDEALPNAMFKVKREARRSPRLNPYFSRFQAP